MLVKLGKIGDVKRLCSPFPRALARVRRPQNDRERTYQVDVVVSRHGFLPVITWSATRDRQHTSLIERHALTYVTYVRLFRTDWSRCISRSNAPGSGKEKGEHTGGERRVADFLSWTRTGCSYIRSVTGAGVVLARAAQLAATLLSSRLSPSLSLFLSFFLSYAPSTFFPRNSRRVSFPSSAAKHPENCSTIDRARSL